MKTRKIFSMALIALMGVSCQIESLEIVQENTVLQAEVVDGKDTRVAFDPAGQFFWTENDAIGIWLDGTSTEMKIKEGAGTGSASFVTTQTGEKGLYAIYPFNKLGYKAGGTKPTYKLENNHLLYSVPEEDNLQFGDVDANYPQKMDAGVQSFNPLMLGKIEGENVSFKHLGGVICLKLVNVNVADVTKFDVIIQAYGGNISGDYDIDLSESVPQWKTIKTDPSAMSQRIYHVSDPEGKLNIGVFYIPIPVGTYDQLKVKCVSKAINDEILVDKTYNNVTVERCDLIKTNYDQTDGKEPVGNSVTFKESGTNTLVKTLPAIFEGQMPVQFSCTETIASAVLYREGKKVVTRDSNIAPGTDLSEHFFRIFKNEGNFVKHHVILLYNGEGTVIGKIVYNQGPIIPLSDFYVKSYAGIKSQNAVEELDAQDHGQVFCYASKLSGECFAYKDGSPLPQITATDWHKVPIVNDGKEHYLPYHFTENKSGKDVKYEFVFISNGVEIGRYTFIQGPKVCAYVTIDGKQGGEFPYKGYTWFGKHFELPVEVSPVVPFTELKASYSNDRNVPEFKMSVSPDKIVFSADRKATLNADNLPEGNILKTGIQFKLIGNLENGQEGDGSNGNYVYGQVFFSSTGMLGLEKGDGTVNYGHIFSYTKGGQDNWSFSWSANFSDKRYFKMFYRKNSEEMEMGDNVLSIYYSPESYVPTSEYTLESSDPSVLKVEKTEGCNDTYTLTRVKKVFKQITLTYTCGEFVQKYSINVHNT